MTMGGTADVRRGAVMCANDGPRTPQLRTPMSSSVMYGLRLPVTVTST
jgi:hypothetical protein